MGEEEGGRGLCLSSEGVGEAFHSKDCEMGTFPERALSLLLSADGDASVAEWCWRVKEGREWEEREVTSN